MSDRTEWRKEVVVTLVSAGVAGLFWHYHQPVEQAVSHFFNRFNDKMLGRP